MRCAAERLAWARFHKRGTHRATSAAAHRHPLTFRAAELIDAFLLLLVCVVAFVGAYAAIKVLPAPK